VSKLVFQVSLSPGNVCGEVAAAPFYLLLDVLGVFAELRTNVLNYHMGGVARQP
jgi:hypothetical protein